MANDIVFLLRFDTEAGRKQVEQLAKFASTAVNQALHVKQPAGLSISRALGLDEALSKITTAEAKLSGLGNRLSKLNLSQLDDLRRRLTGFGGTDDTEDIKFIDRARVAAARREDLQDHLAPFTGTAGASRQASLETRRPSESFATYGLHNAAEPDLRTHSVVREVAARTQANKDKGAEALAIRRLEEAKAARDLALQQFVEPFLGVAAAAQRASLDNRRARINLPIAAGLGWRREIDARSPEVIAASSGRTQASKKKGIEALISGEVEAADAARLERRAPKLREQELKLIEKKIALTKSDLDRNALVSRRERSLETQRLDGLRKVVQNLRRLNREGLEGGTVERFTGRLQDRLTRVRQRTRLAGDPGSSSSGNALGISRAATHLLAFSSVVGQLSPRLGAVTMSAGFAAFSLGGLVASLSLAAAGIAGYINVLKKSIDVSKQAGLTTVKYSRAQIGLNLQIDGFFKVLGIKTQIAFVPVLDSLGELTKEFQKMPWDEMVEGSAAAAKAMIDTAAVFLKIANTEIPFLGTTLAEAFTGAGIVKGIKAVSTPDNLFQTRQKERQQRMEEDASASRNTDISKWISGERRPTIPGWGAAATPINRTSTGVPIATSGANSSVKQRELDVFTEFFLGLEKSTEKQTAFNNFTAKLTPDEKKQTRLQFNEELGLSRKSSDPKALGPEQTRFVHTPSFSFKPVQDVGKSIQEALLKNESKDPLVRAAELHNALLRDIYKELQGIGGMPIADILEHITPGIVVN